MSNKVTLRDIASAANVSNCTASKALRGDSKISEKTRNKVIKIANKLGYNPDPEVKKFMSYMSRRRKTNITSAIGILTPYTSSEDAEQFDYYMSFENAVRERAQKHGYNVDIFYMQDPEMRPERLSQIIETRGLDGLIVSATGSRLESLPIEISGIPVVSCMQNYITPRVNRVDPDYFRNTWDALSHSNKLGYKKPLLALVGGYHEITDGITEAAYHHFGANALNKRMPAPLISVDYNYRDLPHLIKKHNIDHIVSNSFLTLNWMYEYGYTVDELGFTCLNILPKAVQNSQLHAPFKVYELSGIDTRAYDIDTTVVDTLVGMILRNEQTSPDTPHVVTIKGQWHDGKTLPDRT